MNAEVKLDFSCLMVVSSMDTQTHTFLQTAFAAADADAASLEKIDRISRALAHTQHPGNAGILSSLRLIHLVFCRPMLVTYIVIQKITLRI